MPPINIITNTIKNSFSIADFVIYYFYRCSANYLTKCGSKTALPFEAWSSISTVLPIWS